MWCGKYKYNDRTVVPHVIKIRTVEPHVIEIRTVVLHVIKTDVENTSTMIEPLYPM
jgi:hypothetical protein